MAIIRTYLLNIPIDHLPDEDIEQTVLSLLERNEPQHIMFLTLWDLLKARRNTEFRTMVQTAALCLPLSKSLTRAARFLNLPIPARRDTFDMIIRMLHVIDLHHRSLYLLGGRPQSLIEAERNVRVTFPHIQVVGRFSGFYHKRIEKDIITSLVKSSPAVIIVGNGMQGDIKWIHTHRNKLPNSIVIHNNDIIDIFSKRKKRISDATFRKGREFIPQLISNPFKILYIFRYLLFLCVLLFYKISGKGSK